MKDKDTRYSRFRWIVRGAMARHNQILIGLLAIQIVLSLVVFWPKSAATSEGKPVFPDLEAEDVVALTITDGDGKSIALQKAEGSWGLPAADGYPAESDKIDTLLKKILSLTTGRLVTRTDASHRRLEVAPDSFVRRIEFETTDGTTHTLYLGSSPQYGATHFREDGQSETYLSNELSSWDVGTSATSWVDTLYLSAPPEDITKITLENGNGALTFTKEGVDSEDGGHWMMAGLTGDEALNESTVDTLTEQAASVHMTWPLGTEAQAAYGMDQPVAVVTLETAERAVTLHVGAQDPDDNSYVVKSSESAYYVRAAEYSVKDLVEWAREDFLEAQPTPTPQQSANP
jgi:hypothetical protein